MDYKLYIRGEASDLNNLISYVEVINKLNIKGDAEHVTDGIVWTLKNVNPDNIFILKYFSTLIPKLSFQINQVSDSKK